MMKQQTKAKVVTDIKNNRLYIIFDNHITKKDTERIYTDIRFGVADLQPGFSVINDLSLCRIGHLSGIASFKRIAAFLAEKKVGRVIRVTGSSSLIFKQISKLSTAINGYKPEYVDTVEEAEELLEQGQKK